MTKLIELIKIWDNTEEIKADLANNAHIDNYINQQDEVGRTALHITVDLHDIQTAKLLVESGIDINIRDVNGRTALDLAYKTPRLCVKIIKLLEETSLRRKSHDQTN